MSNSILRRLSVLLLVLLGCGAPSQSQVEPRVLNGFVLQEKGGAFDQVIGSEEQFRTFVAAIPSTLPDKRRADRPNPDPLRGDFRIDFSKQVLVVAVHRDTLSAFPEYLGTSKEADGISVDFTIPEPPPEARPYGWGVYTAVLLPKSEHPHRIVRKG